MGRATSILPKKKRHWSVFDGVIFAVLTIYSLGLVLLLVWALCSSFRMQDSYLAKPLSWIKGEDFTFDNYLTVFDFMRVLVTKNGQQSYVHIETMFLYSVLYAGGCAIIQTLVTATVAYLTAKYDCLLSKIVHYSVIFTMVLPIIGNMSSMIQVLRAMHLYDTMLGMYVMKFGYANIYYLIFYAAFNKIPKDYTEYALVEGASHFKIFSRIMMPMVLPLLGTVTLLLFINYWNDYQVPYVYLPSEPTAALGLYAVLNVNTSINDTPFKIASGIVVFIPIFIIFLIFKNKIMANIDEGGVKG